MLGKCLVGFCFMLYTGRKELLFDVKLQHDFNINCFVDASIPAGTVLLANGVPYTYQNGMAIFHAQEGGGYPLPQPQISSVSEYNTPTLHWIRVLHLSTSLRRRKM